MPAFTYVAVDGQGRTQRGVVDAEAARQARAELRSAGLIPVTVEALEPEATVTGRRLLRPRRLSAAMLALLTRRFAMLLEAGLSVEETLAALIEQTRDDVGGRILSGVRAEVLAGHSLGSALDSYPSSFPDIYRALVRTGEQSGELAVVLTRLADYLERRTAMRQSAGLALLYPAIVAGVALVMIVGLMTYVVPQVVQVFEQSRQALPFLTRALLWVTDALQGKLLILGVVACLLAVGARAAYSRPGVRLRVQGSMLRLPLLGSLIQGLETARLASTLAILVGGGVPLLQALETGAAVVGALPLRRAVEEAARRVREGSSLHRALGGQGLFPPIFIHLIASGEASGRLSHMLSQAARQQEFENDGRIRLLTGILEPGVVVVMGIAVLLVVLAVLLPIIEINQLVRR